MEFIETSIFTRQVQSILADDEYRLLQVALIIQPDKGNIIEGSGGLRKLRWPLANRGKRSGARVIYYWAVRRDKILMLLIYPKSVQDDLTSEQLKVLKKLVMEEFS